MITPSSVAGCADRRRVRRVALLGVVSTLAALTVAVGPSADAAPVPSAKPAVTTAPGSPFPGSPHVTRTCGEPKKGHASCFSLRRTDLVRRHVAANEAVPGLSPDDLVGAYRLPTSTNPGPTVAIVDAFDGPNTESDLAQYRAQFGLPACTTANGCFTKLNQSGAKITGSTNAPAPDGGWAAEIALDVDMVSAVCPQCNIMLVEADSDSLDDLTASVKTAVAKGAKYVSNSYGAAWDPTAEPYNSTYTFPGVAMVASTGDDGYGPSFPASVPAVTAVGGTTLKVQRSASGTTRLSETAWEGAGSGCASTGRIPYFQGDVSTGCNGRGQADVAAVADPEFGVSSYFTYPSPVSGVPQGWGVAGGTSASAPIIAGLYAMAGAGGQTGAPPSAYPYHRPAAFNDVTSGSNYFGGSPACASTSPLCHARPGWDGITGLGSPNGITGFSPAPVSDDPYLSGGPAIASWAAGRLDVVARNARKQMIWRTYSGGRWGPWVTVGGTLASQPSLTTWGTGRLDAVALDANKRLMRNSYSGGRWSGWATVNSTVLGSAPAIGTWGFGRLDVVARSTTGHLLHSVDINAHWSAFEDRGGSLTSAPSMTSWGSGRLDAVALNSTHQLTHYAFGTGAKGTFDTPSGGALSAAPGIGSDNLGHLAVVARDASDHFIYRTFGAGRWSAWSRPSSVLLGASAIGSDAPGRYTTVSVDVYYQGVYRTLSGNRWTPWTGLGGTIT